MTFFLASTLLIIAVSFFVSFQSAATAKKNVILGVTIPREVQGDLRVRDIVSRYKRANLLLFFAALVGGILIALPREASLVFLLLTLWLGLLLLGGNMILGSYSQSLRDLKAQEGWYMGATNTVSVDLIVSREKEKMPVPRLWFLPPVLAAVGLLVWGGSRDNIFFGALACGETLLFYLLWVLSARERARAYSDDTEVNLAITRLSIRGWTLCWVALANVHSLLLLFSALFLGYSETGSQGAVAALISLVTLGSVVMMAAHIRRSQNRILNSADSILIVDEDDYWRGGVYNNPHDRRILVEKRVGYGQTFNIGSKKGKLLYYGIITAVSLLVLGVLFLFVGLDTAQYTLEITDSQVIVKAPLYGFAFSTGDVENISLMNELPRSTRMNGAETAQYSLGNFIVTGFGQSKLYVYKNSPPYIAIQLSDLYVFFNAKTVEETEGYYRELQELIP